MCAHFPSEFLNGGSAEKLIKAVRKPDNHVGWLWTCFFPPRTRGGIDWSGFKVGGDLTVQSRAHWPCKWRGHPVGPIRSAWRQCNLSFVTYPAIECATGEDYRQFSSSVRHSPQSKFGRPRNWIYFRRFILLVVYVKRKIGARISEEIDMIAANDAHSLVTSSGAWEDYKEGPPARI
jgi:hypothetical protein